MEALIRRLIALLEAMQSKPSESANRSVYHDELPDDYTVVDDMLLKEGTPVRVERTGKHGGKMDGPRFIVLHYTANNALKGTINVFKKYSVSAHLVMDMDGTTVQMVPFDTVAWHAGKSKTKSKWGTAYSGLNKCAIGIEIINYGYEGSHVAGGTDTSEWVKARHANGGPERKWQPYPQAQVAEVEKIVAALMKQYNIPIEHVLGHDEVSPDRKVDPGPAFPMGGLRAKLGERV